MFPINDIPHVHEFDTYFESDKNINCFIQLVTVQEASYRILNFILHRELTQGRASERRLSYLSSSFSSSSSP